MSLKWTLLTTLALFVLVIATFVVFEFTVRPLPSRRQQFANGVWTLAGLLFLALWAWFSLRKGKRGQ